MADSQVELELDKIVVSLELRGKFGGVNVGFLTLVEGK